MTVDRKRVYTSKTTDPRWLMKRQLRLMAVAQKQMADKAKRREEFTPRDIGNMCAVATALDKLIRRVEDDDRDIYRQMEGKTDAELLAELKSKIHGAKVSRGKMIASLEKDIHISKRQQDTMEKLTYDTTAGDDEAEDESGYHQAAAEESDNNPE